MTTDPRQPAGPSVEEAPSHSISHGLRWSLLGQVGLRLLTFATGIALARLLVPSDFGTYAVALAIVNLLGAVNEAGVMPAIVRWKGHPAPAVRTGMTIAGCNSLLLYVLLFLSAPALATALGSPDATGELRVLGLTVIADGFSAPYQALLHRSFAQHLQARAEVVGMLVYAGTATALAALGWGGMSIAVASAAGAVVTGAFFIVVAPFRTPPGWSGSVAGEVLGFGVPIALAALLGELVLNVDYIIVGAVLGPSELGQYLLAFNLSSWPVTLVSLAVGKVAFAGFTTIAHDKVRLTEAAARTTGLALTVAVPMVLLLAVLADDVVRVLYGDQWLPAAVAVRFLAVLGGLRLVIELLGDCVAADGHPGRVLGIRAVWLAVLAPSLFVGAQGFGIVGVGVAHLLVAVFVAVPLLLLALAKAGISPRRLAGVAVRPLTAGVGAGAAMWMTSPLVTSPVLRVLLLGAVGAVCYGLLVLPRNELVRWAVEQARGSKEKVT